MQDIILRRYTPSDRQVFREINEAWITEHFSIEEKDREVLGDPGTYILQPGGQILIAEIEGRIAGCCALLAEPGGFEIGKMAVRAELRGRGIGRRLLLYAIETARALGARHLSLESNRKLPDAVHLYESVGFRHIPPERIAPSPYARSDIHMEMELKLKES